MIDHMTAAEPIRKRPAPGELVTCPDCGGKDHEIRFGTEGDERPTVTCAGCLKMWWLTASLDAARAVRLQAVWLPDVAPLPDHLPDWAPEDLEVPDRPPEWPT
jgi:hypothetical protein